MNSYFEKIFKELFINKYYNKNGIFENMKNVMKNF